MASFSAVGSIVLINEVSLTFAEASNIFIEIATLSFKLEILNDSGLLERISLILLRIN